MMASKHRCLRLRDGRMKTGRQEIISIAGQDTRECSEKEESSVNIDYCLSYLTQAIRAQHPFYRRVYRYLVVAASFSLCYRAQSQQSPLPSAREMVHETPVCDSLIEGNEAAKTLPLLMHSNNNMTTATICSHVYFRPSHAIIPLADSAPLVAPPTITRARCRALSAYDDKHVPPLLSRLCSAWPGIMEEVNKAP